VSTDAIDNACPICGSELGGVHCKLICPNCGYREDCSDLFRLPGPPARPAGDAAASAAEDAHAGESASAPQPEEPA